MTKKINIRRGLLWMIPAFCFLFNPNIAVIDFLPDFIGYFFLCIGLSKMADLNEELYEAILKTETALARGYDRTGEYLRVPIKNTSDIDRVHDTLQKYNETLPKNISSSRNFRLFYLRSIIDYELARCDYRPVDSERCQEALRELFDIYYSDERTYPSLRPPYGKFAKSDLFHSQAY